jgi:ribonuclease BN (tRNA processing enzyme)
MRLTIVGGVGAFPDGGGCSGYLVEHDGFRLLVDPGYATVPALLPLVPAAGIDAVLVSHGHPDHCADLNPLLRARALADEPPPALPVFTLPGSLDAVLALDGSMLDGSYRLHEFAAGQRFAVGPFDVSTWALPHFVPNAGLRLHAGGTTLAYTGDTGPSPDVVTLARDADILLAEATFPEHIRPAADAPFLSTARQAGEYATRADVGTLVLTHLWPGTDPAAALAAAAYAGRTEVATPGRTFQA